VQNVPFSPLNFEHSLVTRRAPLRGNDAAAVAAPPEAVAVRSDEAEVALGLVGSSLPLAQPMGQRRKTETSQNHALHSENSRECHDSSSGVCCTFPLF